MFCSQTLYHVHQIPVLGVQLSYTFRVTLVSPYAYLMTPRYLVLVIFKVFGDFFRRIVV